MSIKINKKTVRISVLCVAGALACTTGVLYGKADKKDDYKEMSHEMATIEQLIGEDGLEDFINETEQVLSKEEEKRKIAEKAAELEKAKEEYTNWIDGIDLRDYFKDEDYKGYCIVDIDGKNTNIRSEADEKSDRVGIIPNHGIAKIKEEKDAGGKKWYRVESGGVEDGYILSDYVKTGDEGIKLMKHVGYLSIICKSGKMNVRKEESTDSDIVTTINESNHVAVLGISKDWVKVSIGDNEGFVSREHVDIEFYLPKATAVKEKKKENSSNNNFGKANGGSSDSGITSTSTGGRQDIVNEALKYVGCAYVSRGTSPDGGFDCSGFTMYVYGKFGISLPHQSGSQRSCGTEVSEAAPGDLICYSGHVAIYIGNGQIVHASTPKTGVCIGSLNMGNVLSIRRF